MKKLVVFAIIVTALQVNFPASGQDRDGYSAGRPDCVMTLLQDLSFCLRGNGVSYHMIGSGSTYYIVAQGTPPPGQIQSCLSQYNADANSCPEAPVVVMSTGTATVGRKN